MSASHFLRLPVREGHVEQLLPTEPDEPHRPTEARQWPQLRGHPPGHKELQEQAGQGEQAEQGCVFFRVLEQLHRRRSRLIGAYVFSTPAASGDDCEAQKSMQLRHAERKSTYPLFCELYLSCRRRRR